MSRNPRPPKTRQPVRAVRVLQLPPRVMRSKRMKAAVFDAYVARKHQEATACDVCERPNTKGYIDPATTLPTRRCGLHKRGMRLIELSTRGWGLVGPKPMVMTMGRRV